MSEPKQSEPMFDREDCLYLAGMGCIGGGAAWVYPPAGLVSLGVMLVGWPFVARALQIRNEVPK